MERRNCSPGVRAVFAAGCFPEVRRRYIMKEGFKASEAKNYSYLACHRTGVLAFFQTLSHPYVLTTKQPMFLALVAGSIFQNIGFFSSSLFILK